MPSNTIDCSDSAAYCASLWIRFYSHSYLNYVILPVAYSHTVCIYTCTATCWPSLTLVLYSIMASWWAALAWTSYFPALLCQVAYVRDRNSCLSLQVKQNRVTLPLWILITVLQMPSPKMMAVSSPHATATSTLRSQVRQGAMVKAQIYSLLKSN